MANILGGAAGSFPHGLPWVNGAVPSPRVKLVNIKDPHRPLRNFSAEAACTLEKLLLFHSEKDTPGKGFINEV